MVQGNAKADRMPYMLKILSVPTNIQLSTCFPVSEVESTELGFVWTRSDVMFCVRWDEIVQGFTEKVRISFKIFLGYITQVVCTIKSLLPGGMG